MNKPRRRLTEDELDAIAKRYREGGTLLSLGFEFDCSPCTIRNALIARGVTRRPAAGRGRARLNFSPEKRA